MPFLFSRAAVSFSPWLECYILCYLSFDDVRRSRSPQVSPTISLIIRRPRPAAPAKRAAHRHGVFYNPERPFRDGVSLFGRSVQSGMDRSSGFSAFRAYRRPPPNFLDMSRHMSYMTFMAVGKSNRIVIDVDDVALKRRLYSALTADGRSLKDWFVSSAKEYLDGRETGRQLPLPALTVAEERSRYETSGGTKDASVPESPRPYTAISKTRWKKSVTSG